MKEIIEEKVMSWKKDNEFQIVRAQAGWMEKDVHLDTSGKISEL